VKIEALLYVTVFIGTILGDSLIPQPFVDCEIFEKHDSSTVSLYVTPNRCGAVTELDNIFQNSGFAYKGSIKHK